MSGLPGPLVSTAWLANALGSASLSILDASWYLPAASRQAKAEHQAAHIPGALFFDLDAMSDETSPYPHMLPSPDVFAARIGALGVASDDTVVVYDGAGLFSAPRVWWMFRAMGHDRVAVLDGGFPKWQAEGRPTEPGLVTRKPRRFVAKLRPELIRGAPHLEENIRTRKETVVDARSATRFAGREPEPRQGVRPGHIPGARNLPYASLLNTDGTLKSADALRAAFVSAGLDLTGPLVTSCGSGVTAAILSLALERIGIKDVPIYDGSWAEWGARHELPAETGAATDHTGSKP